MRCHLRTLTLMLAALLLLVVGCASEPPTVADEDADDTEASDDDADDDEGDEGDEGEGDEGEGDEGEADAGPSALDAVYDEIEGLDFDARIERLIELAEDEGRLTWYGSTNADELEPFVQWFQERTGVEVDVYRTTSDNVLQRASQERDAGVETGDVFQVPIPYIEYMNEENFLASYDSPVTEELVDEVVFEDWVGFSITRAMPSWNPDRVGDNVPETWEDVMTNYGDGELALEVREWDTTELLIKEYWVGDQGMTEEEAIELYKDAAAGAQCTHGKTATTTLLVAGEMSVYALTNHHRILFEQGRGAPIEYEPVIQPYFIRPVGVAANPDTQEPASALLWVDLLLSQEGQEVLADSTDRTPANRNVEGGIPEDHWVILQHGDDLEEREAEWRPIYDDIMSHCAVDRTD